MAVDADRLAAARDQEQQRDTRIGDEVAQTVDAVVAPAIRNQKRFLVPDANKTRRVATRGAIQSPGAAGCHGAKWRRFDEGAVVGVDVIDLFEHRRPGRLTINRLEDLDRGDVMVRAVNRHVAILSLRSSNQVTAIMADHLCLYDETGFDRSIEAHRREMLGAPAGARLGKNAAHCPDLGIEMASQSNFAATTQAAGAILDHLARDLRHAGSGRAGARRVGKYVQMDEPAFFDEVEGAPKHILGFGRKSRNDVGAEHHAGTAAAQLLTERNGIRTRMASLHPLEDEI